MRYELGALDKAQIPMNRTFVGNTPAFFIDFKDKVDVKRLHDATLKAFKGFPLFGCRVCYKHGYYYETNDSDVVIQEGDFNKRNPHFGEESNWYPFRLCVDNKRVLFEWLHSTGDGKAGLGFLKEVLSYYFIDDYKGEEDPKLNIYDKLIVREKIKPYKEKKLLKGSKTSLVNRDKISFSCRHHLLVLDALPLVAFCKENEITPMPLLLYLGGKSYYDIIKEKTDNPVVNVAVYFDARKILGVFSNHNLIFENSYSYYKKLEELDLKTQLNAFRSLLDVTSSKDNALSHARGLVNEARLINAIHPRSLRQGLVNFLAPIIRKGSPTLSFTYLGRTNFPEEVNEGLDNVEFMTWADAATCSWAIIDFNGRFNISMGSFLAEEAFLLNLKAMLKKLGIPLIHEKSEIFHQSAYY